MTHGEDSMSPPTKYCSAVLMSRKNEGQSTRDAKKRVRFRSTHAYFTLASVVCSQMLSLTDVPEAFGLLASFGYAGSILLLGETALACGSPRFITRKLVHVLAGCWTLAIVALFTRVWVGILPFAAFIVINYVLYRMRVLRSIDSDSPGVVYFALSITVIFLLLWEPLNASGRSTITALCAVMAMTWGDASAAIVGKTFGVRTYTIAGTTRTVEGSVAMLLASFLSMWVTASVLKAGVLMFAPLMSSMVIAAVVATVAEAVSPHGTDNLTVPFLTALTLYVLL